MAVHVVELLYGLQLRITPPEGTEPEGRAKIEIWEGDRLRREYPSRDPISITLIKRWLLDYTSASTVEQGWTKVEEKLRELEVPEDA